ncbi:MAG: hypothetical protein GWN61_16390, partial [candidate division Zixibacteria bacterium]|nr:hypothetical protein [candidate division Zixibacteria bacterium]NIW46949.1 hypothetical protein [Gammaproteobacteria bacterium]NIS47469.1 hypothetical protein [candidate division Zixibacteria bacterium]NIU15565.1 hypothetical protein [candidate division Zixibacteria bacterium]NIV07703.1 hypothetical protein [candidate division Zixibacteria bacterium]
RGQLPGFDKDYITVTMEYSGDPGIGKTQKDSYKLYIDPDTYLLQGYEYVIGYGQMLELMKIPEGQLIGPMLRIHDKLTEVDGLVVPTKMHTMAPDGSATFGYHVLINYAFDQKFDETRMNPPSDAVVDNSSASR